MKEGLKIKSCLVILLATILLTTLAGVLVKALPIEESISEAVGYTLGMGLSALFAVRLYQRHVDEFSVEINSSYLVYTPLLVVWPILLKFGITSHLMYLIPTPESLVGMYDDSGDSILWLSIITVALIGPVLEEVIFRGVILKGLLGRYSPLKAIVVSSLLFGLVHLNPWQFAGAFGTGIICGWIYWKTNNLILPIIMHISSNLFFTLFGMHFGSSYLIDTPMQQVFGSHANQLLAVSISIILFGVIWFVLSKRIRYTEVENTSYNQV
jgi:uncharacterized protein